MVGTFRQAAQPPDLKPKPSGAMVSPQFQSCASPRNAAHNATSPPDTSTAAERLRDNILSFLTLPWFTDRSPSFRPDPATGVAVVFEDNAFFAMRFGLVN